MSRFQLYQAVVTDVVVAHGRCDIDMNGRGFFDVDVNPAYKPKAGDRCWVLTRGAFPPWVLDKVRGACRPTVARGVRRWWWQCAEHGVFVTDYGWRDALAEARAHARYGVSGGAQYWQDSRIKNRELAAIGWDRP